MHFAIVDDLLLFAVVLSDQVMIQVPEDYVESGCVQVGIRNCYHKDTRNPLPAFAAGMLGEFGAEIHRWFQHFIGKALSPNDATGANIGTVAQRSQVVTCVPFIQLPMKPHDIKFWECTRWGPKKT